MTPENNLVKHHTDISEVEGTSAASEKYICMAKSVIVVLAKYKKQELVNQMQGYLDKAAVMKKKHHQTERRHRSVKLYAY